jgi:putative transposase
MNRSVWYYRPVDESEEDLLAKRLIDEQYTSTPFYGSGRMTVCLQKQGLDINRKRVTRLMREMGIQAIYPKPKLSTTDSGHKIYPYLLGGLRIDRPDRVWSSDITYIRMSKGFVYLTAVMDWYSRYVLSWSLSNTMDVHFCLEALQKALTHL